MATTRKTKEKDLIDQMLDQIDLKGMSREEIPGQQGLLKQLTGKLLSRVLNAEMDGHLGYEKHSSDGNNSGDSRNGHSEKTVLTGNRSAVIPVPRDRDGTFEPKHQRRLPLFNDQIISMCSFGMTDRDIRAHLEKIYTVEVWPELISRVTEAVIEEVKEWQDRRLKKSYAMVCLDALRVKTRQDGKSRITSVRVAPGLCMSTWSVIPSGSFHTGT